MTKRLASPAKPHAKVKAERRVLSPDDAWAADIRERILADCHPWQYDAAVDRARRVSLLVGRGGAKTTTMRVRGLNNTVSIRNGKTLYVATSRQQAEELNWHKLKDACESYGLTQDMVFMESKLHMTCRRTGARYRLFGVEDRKDAEKLRGEEFDEVQIDECGSFDPVLLEYLIDRVLAPRFGSRNCKLILGSTPPHVLSGPFYEATRQGSTRHRPYSEREKPEFANWKGFSSHFWTLKDVYELPDAREKYPALVGAWEEALVEKSEKGWSDDHPIWMREYLGKWSQDNTATVFRYRPHVDGQPWNEWDPFGDHPLEGILMLRGAITKLPELGTWHFAVAMDMGSRDPFACNVFAFAPSDPERRIFHVYAFERTGIYARAIAELLLGPELSTSKPDGVLGVIGWPDGMIIDADQALIDELRNEYGLGMKKAERKADYKFGAIELVNGDLVDGRIKLLKNSPLVKQIEVLQWKPDDNGNPREDKAQANHSTDCLVYGRRLISNLFESGIVTQEGQATPVYRDPMGLDGSDDQFSEGDEDSNTADMLASESYGWG